MAVSISDLLAKDAAFYVRRWASEMQVTEAEIVARLVRQSVLVLRVRHTYDVIDDARAALEDRVKVPFGQTNAVVLAAINSRPGPWTLSQIRAHLRETTNYFIKPNVLTQALTQLRRSRAIVGEGWGVVRRVERRVRKDSPF